MLMSMADISAKYGPIRSVIHVGAHYGQEVADYVRAGAVQIDLFEPLDSNIEQLELAFGSNPGVVIHQTALGNRVGEAIMHVASNEGQSSSVLEPKDHLAQYPWISFQSSKTVPMARLDDFNLPGADFLAADVQGYELEVFRGARKTLEKVKMVYCEVNRAELYKDCAQIDEIDTFLAEFGFKRIDTAWVGGTWGDALYIKD